MQWCSGSGAEESAVIDKGVHVLALVHNLANMLLYPEAVPSFL